MKFTTRQLSVIAFSISCAIDSNYEVLKELIEQNGEGFFTLKDDKIESKVKLAIVSDTTSILKKIKAEKNVDSEAKKAIDSTLEKAYVLEAFYAASASGAIMEVNKSASRN